MDAPGKWACFRRPASGKNLKAARQMAWAWRAELLAGRDPIEVRNARRRGEAAPEAGNEKMPTFCTVAEEYIADYRREWSDQHAGQWQRTLEKYACHIIGNTPVDEITNHQILEMLNPIWRTKTATAKRVQNRVEKVLAATYSWHDIERPNPALWRDNLDTCRSQKKRKRASRRK